MILSSSVRYIIIFKIIVYFTLSLLIFINGISHLQSMELSQYHFYGYQENSTIKSLVKLHKYAGWPGLTMVAKANHFQFKQEKG